MTFKAVFFLAFLALSIGFEADPIPSFEDLVAKASKPHPTFEEYQIEHKRNYRDAEETRMRKEIYLQKLAQFDEHNAKFIKGEVTWIMGVNQFTDMSYEELNAINWGKEKYLLRRHFSYKNIFS